MFPAWRLRLREARLAWRSGRIDEAGALLSAQPLREFLPAKRLAGQVAHSLVDRARDRFERGDSSAGWRDLAAADRLAGDAAPADQLRRQAVQRAVEEIERYLVAGDSAAAISRLAELKRRGADDEQMRYLRQIADDLNLAENLADRGHFSQAVVAFDRAAAIAGGEGLPASTMDELRKRLAIDRGELVKRQNECQRLSSELHAALVSEKWSDVLSLADAILAMAPQHVAAGQARRHAWKAVGLEVTLPHPGTPPAGGALSLALATRSRARFRNAGSPFNDTSHCEGDTVGGKSIPKRGLLWVDAVGGYLVCLDDVILLGQPTPGEAIAVPIMADVSRRHATIRRDAGVYILDPMHRALVNGRPADGPVVLGDHDLLQLGEGVRLRFTRPHALSATARLVMESNHKTHPTADAILLMADSVVLGPSRHCHVQCGGWRRDVVLYRQGERLFCRADRSILLDGVAVENAAELRSTSRIEGEDFALSWEAV